MLVLVVDDDIMITDIMYDQIKLADPTAIVATAHSCDVALKLMSTFKVDLVFTDLNGCSGAKIYMRALESGSGVVLCTGSISIPQELAGATVLLKPFSYDDILNVIKERKVA